MTGEAIAGKEFWLAYEGGGSKTRILLGDTAGTIVGREVGGSASQLYVNATAYARATRPMLIRLRKRATEAGGRVTTVGLAAPMNLTAVEGILRDVFGEVRLVKAGEGELALAHYGLRYGVSLVAGTGASCRCVDERGRQVSVGGFGPQFGDEGSGYWIGRQGVSATFREGDGRGEKTSLTGRVRAHFRIQEPWEILGFVDSGGHVAGPLVASFATEVVAAAREGDPVARRILARAGRHLGRLVLAAVGRSKIRHRPIPLVPTGGVFGAGHFVLTPLKRILGGSHGQFEVLPPVLEPAQGLFQIIAMRGKER